MSLVSGAVARALFSDMGVIGKVIKVIIKRTRCALTVVRGRVMGVWSARRGSGGSGGSSVRERDGSAPPPPSWVRDWCRDGISAIVSWIIDCRYSRAVARKVDV